jgi:hypothetical protein
MPQSAILSVNAGASASAGAGPGARPQTATVEPEIKIPQMNLVHRDTLDLRKVPQQEEAGEGPPDVQPRTKRRTSEVAHENQLLYTDLIRNKITSMLTRLDNLIFRYEDT